MARNFDSAEDFALSKSKGMSSDRRMVRYRPSAKPMFDYQIGYDFGAAARNLASMPSKLMESLQKLPQAAADSSGKDYQMDMSSLQEKKEYPPLLPVRGLPKASSSMPVAGGGMSSDRRTTRTRVPNEPGPVVAPSENVTAPTPQVQPSPEPMGPSYTESALSQKRQLRNEIQYQQDMLRKDRMTKNLVQGSKDDADRLGNIHRLWSEYHAFEKAGAPVQQPGSVDSNFNSIRSASAQAAKIMQGDLAAMEQKVYTMPPGPQRDAEVEKLRAFKQRTNEQEMRGNTLRPGDYGPSIGELKGTSANEYGNIQSEAERATRGQSAMVGRQQQMRQEAYNFANTIQDKRLAEEAQTKRIKDEAYNAGLANLNRPEREFQAKQEQAAAENRRLDTQNKLTEAQAGLVGANTDVAKYNIDPNNPNNRLASASADLTTSEIKRRADVAAGKSPPQTPEEIESRKNMQNFAAESSGVDQGSVSSFMDASNQLKSALGGPSGDAIVSNGHGALKASNVMMSTAQALRDMASKPEAAEAAKVQARQLLAGMGVPSSGKFITGRSFASSMAGGVLGTLAAGPAALTDLATGGVLNLSGRAFNAAQMPLELDNNNKVRAAQNLNSVVSILRQIAGQ